MTFENLLNLYNIKTLNYDEYFKNIYNFKDYFFEEPSKQHYRLLSYMSTLYDGVHILDIGTHVGDSCMALSYNENNIVYTFDIRDDVEYDKNIKKNIKFNFEDILTNNENREKWKDIILNSAFIFLDVDPHNGNMEYDFYLFLKENDYKGFVICDDIWYFKDMRNNFWYKIPFENKYDISEFGHWSGTGIFTFNPEIKFNKNDNSDWTLVTAYFNLTNCEDASVEINKRDKNYYLSSAVSTLTLPYNLVIYCDNGSYEEIVKIRPTYLEDKTKYILIDFDSFTFNEKNSNKTFKEYRNIINENRKNKPYYFDNRNTASYYLFCMSRYIMLKETIKQNYFNSTHFGWINFCIERMGYLNLKHLDEGLSLHRDKFSTCYIDYIPNNLINNLDEYFRWGRCSMCSGFFTGNKNYMYKVCDLIENKFIEYVNKGYGHADEQLFSPVYFENKELFEHYYGDYQQMITNYKYVYDSPANIINNFITNSYNNKDYTKCIEGCEFLLISIKLKKCNLDESYLYFLYNYYISSKLELNKIYFNENCIEINDEIKFIYNKKISEELGKGNNKECYVLCEKILEYIEKNNIGFSQDILFLIYFSYYVSSFYVNRLKSEEIVNIIFDKCKNNKIFENEYLSKKNFYDFQFSFINYNK